MLKGENMWSVHLCMCSPLFVYLPTKTKNPFANDFMVISLEAL